MNPIEKWHEIVQQKNPDLLDELLAEDCVFYSPIVHTPQQGRDMTKMYLAAAMEVLGGESFRYVREIQDGNQAVLEFMGENEGITINGIDMMTWNDDGKIDSFKVMVRPLKAVNLLHAQMKAMLESFGAAWEQQQQNQQQQ